MNTIPSESDSNAILDRLLSGAGLHRDAQLAALLGVSPQAVSQARRKRKIPEGWVVKVSQQCGLSMDWLMFGKPANRSRCTGLFCLSFRLAVPEGQSRQDGAHEGLR